MAWNGETCFISLKKKKRKVIAKPIYFKLDY